MKKNQTLARRELLTLMGLTAAPFLVRSPIDQLLELISTDVLNKAMAQTVPQMSQTRRMVSIALVGGPPRHLFDMFLKPTANAPFVQNPGFGTRIRSDGTAAFDTYDFNLGARTITLPYIWQFPIAAKGGGWRPMTDLLPNMLSIRGIDLENDGHAPAQVKWDAPIPGGPSISGLIADSSALPLGCIINNFGPKSASFKSPSGAGYTKSSTETAIPPLTLLLAPFSNQQSGDAKKLMDESEVAIDRALERLKYLSDKSTQGTSGAYIDLKKTRALMKRGVAGLDAEWARLLGKYQDLLLRSIQPNAAVPIPGITTALPQTNRNSYAYRLTPDGLSTHRVGNADLGTLMNEASVGSMAEQFALSEYVMMNDLADASYMQMQRFHNVRLENSALETTPNTVIPTPFFAAVHFDAHEIGVVPTTITFSMFFRALGSCMLELMDTLKTKSVGSGKTLFDETVVLLESDFGRSVRDNLSGTDHGFNAGIFSLWNGVIKQPLLAGNIATQPAGFKTFNATLPGSWGYAATIPSYGRHLNIGSYASTLSTLLRVPTPTKNDASLIVEENGQVKLASSIAGEFKNVEENT